MVTQINVSEVKKLLEQQKLEALYSPIHMWHDNVSANTVNTTCNKISGMTRTPTLFVTHSYSLHSNSAQVVRELASCFPHLLIFCFFNNKDQSVFDWVHQIFPKFFNDLPFANLYIIDTSNLLPSDADYLIELNVEANPTVIIAKMGHVIDNFRPNVNSNVVLSEALLQRHREIIVENGRPVIPGDDVAHLMPNYDSGKEDFEKRDRERRRIEIEKERKEKKEEEKRIKAKIAENRRIRRENNN